MRISSDALQTERRPVVVSCVEELNIPHFVVVLDRGRKAPGVGSSSEACERAAEREDRWRRPVLVLIALRSSRP